MLPNASDLTFFIEVAKTLNMSRASERLGITQPALSQAVKRLEHIFGQPLLLRSKNGVSLTKSGEKLSIRARNLIEQWEALKQEASADEAQLKGHYTLGLHPSVALYTLPAVLPGLLQKYPELQIKLVHDLSRNVTEQVISFKVDFGIVVNPVAHPDLVIRELFKDEVSLWAKPQRQTQNCNVLIADPELIQTQDLLRKLGKKKQEFQRSISSSSLEVIKSLVLAGAGVGILPGRVVGKESTKLERLADGPIFQDRICLIYRADCQTSQASKLLSQYLQSSLKDL